MFQIEYKLVKNPNWWEAADQLGIYKRGQGIESRDYLVRTVQLVIRAGIQPGTSDWKSGALTTRPWLSMKVAPKPAQLSPFYFPNTRTYVCIAEYPSSTMTIFGKCH